MTTPLPFGLSLSKALHPCGPEKERAFDRLRPNGKGRPMPATPAWPPQSLPRLFVDQALAEGASVTVDGNYLGAVLRLGPGRPGETVRRPHRRMARRDRRGRARSASRSIVGEQLRERETVPDLWLLFAPIKRGRIDWLVEKATELGVARLVPVITRRTIVDRLNLERLRAHAIEAAEQCERTALARARRAAEARRAAQGLARRSRSSISPTKRGGDAVRARARPGRDPDRPRRRLHRRGARRDPRPPAGPPRLARPAHPARRHRRAGRGQPVDGGAGDWRHGR